MDHGGKLQKRIGNDHNNNGEIQSINRLSALPDEVLASILSLLPIKTVAAFATFSRRWRHLWTTVTAVRYFTSNFNEKSFFIIASDHILPNLTMPLIETFEYHGPIPSADAMIDYSSFMSRLCLRHVKKISVVFIYRRLLHQVWLPSAVFECQSLEVLILGVGFTFTLPDNGIRLPSLKTLRVSIRNHDVRLMEQLLVSCPVLEDLNLYKTLDNGHDESFVISCQNLKRLRLYIRARNASRVVIHTPKLESFHLKGSNLVNYSFTIAMKSLVEAEISTHNAKGIDNGLQRWSILQSIHRIRTVVIGGDTAISDWYNNSETLPFLHDLIELRLSTIFHTCWVGLLCLLCKCPRLEVLAINWEIDGWRDSNWSKHKHLPSCLSSTVKRIEISNLKGNTSDLEVISFFLNAAKVLETLVISDFKRPQAESKFYHTVCKLPRSSPVCQIRISGDC